MTGDVKGTTTTVVDRGTGKGVDVAKASYDAGYPLGNSLPSGFNAADLKYGYTENSSVTGDSR